MITEAQAGTYALSLFAGNTLIWDIAASEEADCLDVTIFNPEEVGGDGFATVTCWMDGERPYGEW